MDSKKLNSLWVERYRPKTLDEMCLREDIKNRILSWGNEIPHLLLVGPVGIGKTTISKIIVTDILKCDYLYINASDENGIDTIRTKVTGFIQTKSLDGNIKVVLLDESDGLSFEAQNSLRNLMETYSETARFILTGNYKHKIGLPLQSRCQLLELDFSKRDLIKRILQILKLEIIHYDNDELKEIVKICNAFYPDFRSVINTIQLSLVNGQWNFSKSFNTNELVKYIWENIENNRSLQTRKYLIENESKFQGDYSRILKDLLNYVYELNIDDDYKRFVILTIADHLEKSTRVLDKEINLFACLLTIEAK